MKVLLLLTDLFKSVGGGQTVYRKIVESTPEVEFYYFRVDETPNAMRPANAHAIPLRPQVDVSFLTPPPHNGHFLPPLRDADQFARSVAGKHFDIVEGPDFHTCGGFLKEAFAHHGVKIGRVVLSLHGNISTSIDLNWGSPGDTAGMLKQVELLQFDAADGVYGLSKRYIAEWQSRVPRDVAFLDPIHFLSLNELGEEHTAGPIKPSLFCIGRSERLKGNDLFIELSRWIDPSLYDRAVHIGHGVNVNGVRSDVFLTEMSRSRGLAVQDQGPLSLRELQALFESKALIVLPVRYDTLNLVCLEALFHGCPVVVSERAGVCDYLDEFHPSIPYVKMQFDNIYGSVAAIEDLLANYHKHRGALRKALLKSPPKASSPLDMRAFYESVLAAPPREKTAIAGPPALWGKRAYSESVHRNDFGAGDADLRSVESSIKADELERNGPLLGFLGDAEGVLDRIGQVAGMSERNNDAVIEKMLAIYDRSTSPILRCNLWQELARLERLRGNDAVAVTYELRIMRLLGDNRLGLLPRVTQSLRANRAPEVAEAIEAMFAPEGDREQAVFELLKRRYESLLHYDEKPVAIMDDRRSAESPKVSVIVSLYNAESKLDFFLTMLCRQSLLRSGKVEVILVDSGSPTNEREAFDQFHRRSPFNALYVRSAERETIQAAWNRGIKLAQAPYLVFLGADEAIYPETLALLADELDHNPSVDWVMADSLVTAVEDDGTLNHDIMQYDRAGGTKNHILLDTCYISWVGGMYRKSIHDRCGYYDEDFRGAGDTEFKNRIFPNIKVKHINRLLGLFLNYPEGQTTASSMAEIEDCRAWYLYRTAGGIRYLFEDLPIEEAEALLALTLGYRKSYLSHVSTDMELAVPLARYILKRKPASALARFVATDVEQLQHSLRKLEFINGPIGAAELKARILGAWRDGVLAQERHRAGLIKLGVAALPTYEMINDNRYEQHSWLWKSVSYGLKAS